MDEHKVFLAFCDKYDPKEIQKIIQKGIETLNISKISGNITIKPNIVIAHKKAAPHSYTRPEVVTGLLEEFNANHNVNSVKITERSGARISTSTQFKRAGYNRLKNHFNNLTLEPLEKTKQKVVELKNSKLHDKVTVADCLVENDFLIYMPKFKFNILVNGITGALKLNIGILDDEERMEFHDMRLPDKIVDLYEVGNPDLIIVDGIIAGHGGSQLTALPYDLGCIIMGTNSLAVDVVLNHIISHDPKQVLHLVEAHKRGYGPIELEEIEIMGESLDFFQKRTQDFEKGYFNPVREFPTTWEILVGDGEATDGTTEYCEGGCHGIVLDELLMAKDRDVDNPKKVNPNVKLVIGKYKGDVEAKTVIIVGNCSDVSGEIKGRTVRVKGCPPTHRDLLVALALDGGLYPEVLRMTLAFPHLPYMTKKFLGKAHKTQTWKVIPELLRHW